jgi:hypothetical protein
MFGHPALVFWLENKGRKTKAGLAGKLLINQIISHTAYISRTHSNQHIAGTDFFAEPIFSLLQTIYHHHINAMFIDFISKELVVN